MALNSWPTLRSCMTGMLVKNKVINGQVGEQSIKGVELCSENLFLFFCICHGDKIPKAKD